jgi:eukaryotic-like serine/threonine-protein kinase
MIRCRECGLRLSESRPSCRVHGAMPKGLVEPSNSQDEHDEQKVELPGYTVERVLGRGGFGVVYGARRTSDARKVAIKLASQAQRGAAERLINEGEALNAIGPPFVPAVHASGEHAGRRYLVLEWIQAATLAERLQKQASPTPVSRFAEYARTILDALEAVHGSGYIHCDLKPENIFPRGESAKLIDFGSARKLQPGPRDASETAALGSAEYMAPEQCEARQDLDERTDIYAVGILFYELLAGAPPFWGNPGEVREAQVSRRPPRLTMKLAILAELDDVVLRCLAKDPAARFADVRSLREALDEALHHQRMSEEAGHWSVLQPEPRPTPASAGRMPAMPPPSRAPAAREKRPVGLLFFESAAGVVQVTQALAALHGTLAQASGARYVGVFGHDVADNPARSALLAAHQLLERKLCERVTLDVAPVTIQVRPSGERRFLSTLFSRAERYPQTPDPAGILLTRSAADVLGDVPTHGLPYRDDLLAVDLADRSSEVTTFGTRGEALFGRDSLLESITHHAMRAAERATPTLVTLIGEPGYGKSLFASTLVQRLSQRIPGARVLKLLGQESVAGVSQPTLRDLLISGASHPSACRSRREFFERTHRVEPRQSGLGRRSADARLGVPGASTAPSPARCARRAAFGPRARHRRNPAARQHGDADPDRARRRAARGRGRAGRSGIRNLGRALGADFRVRAGPAEPCARAPHVGQSRCHQRDRTDRCARARSSGAAGAPHARARGAHPRSRAEQAHGENPRHPASAGGAAARLAARRLRAAF